MTMTNEQADLIIAFNKTVRLLRATLGLAELLLADAELGRQPHRAYVTREALTRCSQRSRVPLRAMPPREGTARPGLQVVLEGLRAI